MKLKKFKDSQAYILLEAMVGLSVLTVAFFGVFYHIQTLINHQQGLVNELELSRFVYDLSTIRSQEVHHQRGDIIGEKKKGRIQASNADQRVEVVLENYDISYP